MLGPILVFDKSALQSFSVDESVWLENFFASNITPLFFVEVLGDLEKQMQDGRTPEQVVGNLAAKTPRTGARPNVHHTQLCLSELYGNAIEMRGVPVIGGGVPMAVGGKKTVVYKESPEEEAFLRWKAGDFLQVERQFAKAWRQSLSELDLGSQCHEFEQLFVGKPKPRTLADVKAFVDAWLKDSSNTERSLRWALGFLGVSALDRGAIIQRWRMKGEPRLRNFAPYTTHVFSVDFFFFISLAVGLIGRERPSNKIDMAYLYYLPFAMVFVSNDNLHQRTVEYFLTADQSFITGRALKEDLAKLDALYSGLPEETKNRGVIQFAPYPPTEGGFAVTQLWDKHMSETWRESARKAAERLHDKKQENAAPSLKAEHLLKEAKPLPASALQDLGKVDQVVFEKEIPIKRGKWRLIPPEAEA